MGRLGLRLPVHPRARQLVLHRLGSRLQPGLGHLPLQPEQRLL